MIKIATKSKEPFTRASLLSINQTRMQHSLTAQTIHALNRPAAPHTQQAAPFHNHPTQANSREPGQANGHPYAQTKTPTASAHPARSSSTPAAAPSRRKLPPLVKPVQKGQKIPLRSDGASPGLLKACFGWNTSDPRCDADVSAFLLGADGKVIGDSWFVFYGQTKSPDGSCRFDISQAADREVITVDINKLNPTVQKIVFVLTINEALSQRLHFGMMQDAYIRILDSSGQECVSYRMTEYYSNVISMMIGEIYEYKGSWKFHAVGNGVARDLAGLCELYGVVVND